MYTVLQKKAGNREAEGGREGEDAALATKSLFPQTVVTAPPSPFLFAF